MTMAAKLRRAPMRIAAGAFILNTGLGKLKGDEATAKAIHGMASGAYPVLGNIEPKPFLKLVGAGETVLGAALLLPIVPAKLAGAGLAGFAGSLLGMWWRTPGMHAEGSPRPTQQGTAVAKDSWLLGIGAGLLMDDLLADASQSRAVRRAEHRAERRAERKAGRRARKLAARAHAAELKQGVKAASAERRRQLRAEANRRGKQLRAEAKSQAKSHAKSQAKAARKAVKQVRESARDAAADAGKSVRAAAESVADKVGA